MGPTRRTPTQEQLRHQQRPTPARSLDPHHTPTQQLSRHFTQLRLEAQPCSTELACQASTPERHTPAHLDRQPLTLVLLHHSLPRKQLFILAPSHQLRRTQLLQLMQPQHRPMRWPG